MAKFCLTSFNFKQLDFEPDKIAVSGVDQSLSWAELYRLCNVIKKELIHADADERKVVVVLSQGLAEELAYMLAAFELGLCFVPLDRDTAKGRLQSILKQLGGGLLADPSNNTLESFGDTVSLSHDHQQLAAYIVFTSGSTGAPKGVVIPLTAVTAFCHWFNQTFDIDPGRVFCNHAPLSFDLAFLSLFPALDQGASVVMFAKSAYRDSRQFIRKLVEQRCNYWVSTPSFAQLCCFDRNFNQETLPQIKYFNFCGENLPSALVTLLNTRFPEARIFNSYGPTEATIAVSAIEIDQRILKQYPERLPVGPQTPELQLVDTDAETQELLISGPTLMMGYLGQLGDIAKLPLKQYHSGDIASLSEGLVFIHGRLDKLVKYNGYRIELDEIDYLICQHPAVAFAKTIAVERGNITVKLLSLVKTKNRQNLHADSLRSYLQTNLPSYMIPNEIRWVDQIPTNSRHKIDIKTLLSQDPTAEKKQ